MLYCQSIGLTKLQGMHTLCVPELDVHTVEINNWWVIVEVNNWWPARTGFEQPCRSWPHGCPLIEYQEIAFILWLTRSGELLWRHVNEKRHRCRLLWRFWVIRHELAITFNICQPVYKYTDTPINHMLYPALRTCAQGNYKIKNKYLSVRELVYVLTELYQEFYIDHVIVGFGDASA